MSTQYIQNNISKVCICDYVNMCATADMFNADSICSNANDSVHNESAIMQFSSAIYGFCVLTQQHREDLPSFSVGGGFPLLLLSVLPPVIPWASWPSVDHGNLPMRRQVTFSSEPKLDDSMTKQTAGQSRREQEYYIICDGRDSDIEASGKPGVFSR
jgi:hypothetical protein